MAYSFLDIAITPSVRAAQEANGTDRLWRDFKGNRDFDRFTPAEAAFLAERDTFFMASVSETGWPYVQHRGGPPGFVKVLDETTLAFADYRGNLQYISLGNFNADDRVALIFVDYARRARLKIYGRVEVVALEAEPDLAEALHVPDYRARPERILKIHLEAFDWNCPQHITPRFTEAEIGAAIAPMKARLEQLESENAGLRARLAELEGE